MVGYMAPQDGTKRVRREGLQLANRDVWRMEWLAARPQPVFGTLEFVETFEGSFFPEISGQEEDPATRLPHRADQDEPSWGGKSWGGGGGGCW